MRIGRSIEKRSRSAAARRVWMVGAIALTACGSPAATGSSTAATSTTSAPPTTSTTTRPSATTTSTTSATSTTSTSTTTTTSTTTSTSTTTTTSTTSTTSTSTTVPARLALPIGPIEQVLIVGDSVLFDARNRSGGRANDIVPLIEAQVNAVDQLRGVSVVNASKPGLATLYAINPAIDSKADTLAEHLPDVLRRRRDVATLIVIVVSSIDLNVTEGRVTGDVVDELVGEFERIRAELVAESIQVAFVPPFGVNDALFDDARNGLSAERDEHHLDLRVDELNAALRASRLPLLVGDFAGLDRDGLGGADREFFVGYDNRADPWPDDGIHPNGVGEQYFASVVGPALVEFLLDANTGNDVW